jgi:dephospho-CoA kinase
MFTVGITGTIGAGKGTIVAYLVQHKKFMHYSVRQFLIDEIQKRGMPVNRDSMVWVANSLRAIHTPSYIIDCLFACAQKQGANAVIESIRTVGEVLSLREQENFVLLAVDAEAELRYQRIRQRNSETDHVSFAQFLDNEQRELNSSDPHKQNLSQCIAMADAVLYNNGSITELHAQVEKSIVFCGNS